MSSIPFRIEARWVFPRRMEKLEDWHPIATFKTRAEMDKALNLLNNSQPIKGRYMEYRGAGGYDRRS